MTKRLFGADNTKLNTVIEEFLKYLQYEKHYSQCTITSYRNDLKQFESFVKVQYGEYNPLTVTPQYLRAWIIALMDVGQLPTSVRRKISAQKSFYKFLIIKGYTEQNPTLKIIPPKLPKPLPKFLKEKDFDNCLQISENSTTFEGVRDALIIEIIYQTGLRRSEVAGLLDCNVDVQTMQLSVVGKGNKERVLPFGESLAQMIMDYRKIREEWFGTTSPYFFLSMHGVAMNPSVIYRIVRNKMGMVTTQEKRSPHVIRHTFATSMLNSGADISSIKELLGHSTLAATQIYTHLSFDQVQDIYKQAHPRGDKKD